MNYQEETNTQNAAEKYLMWFVHVQHAGNVYNNSTTKSRFTLQHRHHNVALYSSMRGIKNTLAQK